MNRRSVVSGAILAGAGIKASGALAKGAAVAIDPLGSAVNTPVAERKGAASIVYFTRDLSPAGLRKIYARINQQLTGRIAVKLHTGEQNGPNIIPSSWVKELIKDIPGATIVETNTYYEGDRYTTEQHRKTLEVNGWTFCPVDIMDEKGTVMLPVKGGKHFNKMSMGMNILNYDSMLVLTHFKGHTMGGFGGSNKNIGIGCADGRIGKKMIHTYPGQGQWSISMDPFMERICESSKATVDHFGKKIAFINVMRRMSVDCDCAGLSAAPVVTPDVGILASLDILAVDQACIDMVYGMNEKSAELRKRIETRHGLRQLSYMKELGMGNDKYTLVDLDK
ncbi:MAG TPA: (Fe-S)-binding protein [Sutterella sp.]|nr:(Fe-S)-binding protein [Sutterella sp.]